MSMSGFCCFCYSWYPTLVHGDLIECMWLFQSSCICWGLFCVWLSGQFWRKFHEVLRRSNSLLFWGETFCRYVKSIWFITSVSSTLCLFSFCFNDLFIGESGVLNSPTINVCPDMVSRNKNQTGLEGSQQDWVWDNFKQSDFLYTYQNHI